jgi:glycolate oxidase FAD binding subunit
VSDPTSAALDDLRKACDDRVRGAETSDAVAGVEPAYVASPTSTAQTAELMRAATAHDLAVVVRGAGTKLHWGMPPRRLDLVVETTALGGVVEHAAGDLITVARAGTPLRALQDELAGAAQQVALDDMRPGSTLGGTVAVSTSGPRRLLYGTMRDLLIGVTFVRADGVVAKAGGKVVKNVAGYDFGKLLTGSYGTLGVVTEVALRLHPLPAAAQVVTASFADPRAAGRAAAAVLGSQLVPSAVEVDQPPDGPTTVAVLLEGVEAGVAGRVQAATGLLPEVSPSADGTAPEWLSRYPFADDAVGLKITTTISRVERLLASARELVTGHGADLHVRGSAAGALYAGLPADTSPDTVGAVVETLRSLVAADGGSVVVLTAPPAVRAGVDLWGPVPGLDLMRRVKDQLDPGHRLAPGRFVGGI